MKRIVEDLRHSQLFFEIMCGLLLLLILVEAVQVTLLADIFNLAAMAAWAAVLVSYSPIVWGGIRRRRPTQYERLAFGICLGAIFVIFSSATQIYANNFNGQWIYSTPFIPAIRSLPLGSGISHEMAAQSIDGQVPTKAMIRLGVWCGIWVFAGLALVLVPRWVAGV